MRYALQVCPYLAAPKYVRRLDDAQVDPEKLPEGILALVDPTVIPDRPEIFVAVMSIGQQMKPGPAGQIYVRPKKRVRFEFWRAGEQLSQAEGFEIANRLVAAVQS